MLELDIWTVLLQFANFAVLAVLLYFVLFRPVMRSMKEREVEKDQAARDTAQDRQEAERLRAALKDRLAGVEEEAAAIIARANEQAETERSALLEEAEAETERILTDEAAEFQGGVGTAGSANIGKRYAMFEAIHGSAPRMVKEGRDQYADPSSLIHAAAMMLNHIGFPDRGKKLDMALDICGNFEKRLVLTGRSTGATGEAFCDYVMETLQDPNLEKRWEEYQSQAKAKAA